MESSMIRMGVIGYGYWGPNLVRNFNSAENSQVDMVCDMNQQSLKKVRKTYPGMQVEIRCPSMLFDPVATPDSARNSHVRLGSCVTARSGVVASATPHANTSTTVVRTAVARLESTPVTPIFAKIAVNPPNSAESNAHVSQLMLSTQPHRRPVGKQAPTLPQRIAIKLA